MASIPNYLINDGLTSREGCRFFEGVCSTARDLGYSSFTFNGVDVELQPAQTFFKTVDSAWYIPKAVGDTEKVVDSAARLKEKLIDSNADWMDAGAATLTLAKDTFKFISDASASLKFFGTLGVAFLAPHVRELGLTKNAFSVYCAVHDIALNSIDLWNDAYGESTDEGRSQRIIVNALSIFGLLSSVCLNGFGALDTLFGSTLKEAGKASIPPSAWNAWKLGGSVSGLIRNTIENCY